MGVHAIGQTAAVLLVWRGSAMLRGCGVLQDAATGMSNCRLREGCLLVSRYGCGDAWERGNGGVGLTESRPSVKGRQSSSRHVATMLIELSGLKPLSMRTADMHSWKSASGRARGKAPTSTFANLREREGEVQVRKVEFLGDWRVVARIFLQ
jgi:hypothetical protein